MKCRVCEKCGAALDPGSIVTVRLRVTKRNARRVTRYENISKY